MDYKHIPVMLKEVLEYLDPQVGQYFIDCTLGGAGYTVEIAKRVLPSGKVLAVDLDKMAIKNAKLLITNYKLHNIILANENFKNIANITKKYFHKKKVNGIVFDLGLSSAQLADRSRGFSFQLDAPLDMDFGCRISDVGFRTTEDIVNNLSMEELEKIIREYGEEKFSKRIARKIVEYRKLKPIETTGRLVEIINQAVPAFYPVRKNTLTKSDVRKICCNRWSKATGKRNFSNGVYKNKKINCATKTFQALRIATNNELENLRQALSQALDLLAPNARIAVISYHSLEDRIVKNFFKQESRDCICPPACPVCQCEHKAKLKILTRRIVRAGKEEAVSNPRSRSAKLRVAEII